MYFRQNTRQGMCCLPVESWLKAIIAVTEDDMFNSLSGSDWNL